MHVFLGICLLLVGFCYTQDEFNFYAGEPLDYSEISEEDIKELKSSTKDGEIKDTNSACLAEIICSLGEDAQNDVKKCYEKKGSIDEFEEVKNSFCAKEPPSQYECLYFNLGTFLYLCFEEGGKGNCSDDIIENSVCIHDVAENYLNNKKCDASILNDKYDPKN